MRLTVAVRPNSSREGVSRDERGAWIARVAAPPSGGRANDRLVELLAARFGVPRRNVTIVRGHGSRIKLVDVAGVQRGV